MDAGKREEDEDRKELLEQYPSSDSAGPWVFIFDNADGMDDLVGCLDKPGGIHEYLSASDNDLTLFTTRSRGVAPAVAGANTG